MSTLNNNEVEITIYEDESIDLRFGDSIPVEYEEYIVKSFAGYEEVAELPVGDKTVYKTRRWAVDLQKSDELPYWHPKAQLAHLKRQREIDRQERRSKANPTSTIPKRPDSDFADGSGKKYAQIKDFTPKVPNTLKSEEVIKFNDGGQWSLEKGDYGKMKDTDGTKVSQYNPADNERRKANNTDTIDSLGNMGRVKNYGAADPRAQQREERRLRRLNSQSKVKDKNDPKMAEYIKQRQAQNEATGENKIKKPSAFSKSTPDWTAEEQIMKSKPTVQLQATDEQLFGAGVVTQEQADVARDQWEGIINNWHKDVQKPVENQGLSKSWGSRGPIHKETLTEEEERIRQIPVDPNLTERD